MNRHISLGALAVVVLLLAGVAAAETPNRVTILYDSFGKSLRCMDWGFAALVEYGGKRILFDTGNNARIFERNVKALGVDLKNIDFVVISHRHADHTSGISYLLTVNPKVKIYVPDEPWGLFARGVTNDFYRKDPSLPADMRYYGGHPPEILEGGTPWPRANFIPVSQRTEVAPGIFILSRRLHISRHSGAEGAVAGHQESTGSDSDCWLLASRRGAHRSGGDRH